MTPCKALFLFGEVVSNAAAPVAPPVTVTLQEPEGGEIQLPEGGELEINT